MVKVLLLGDPAYSSRVQLRGTSCALEPARS